MTSDFRFPNYDVITDFVTLIFQVQPIDMGPTPFAIEWKNSATVNSEFPFPNSRFRIMTYAFDTLIIGPIHINKHLF